MNNRIVKIANQTKRYKTEPIQLVQTSYGIIYKDRNGSGIHKVVYKRTLTSTNGYEISTHR